MKIEIRKLVKMENKDISQLKNNKEKIINKIV